MGVVDIQSKLRLVVGSVKDQASIGKAMMIYNHMSSSGGGYHYYSDIEVAVVRATGHDNNPVDDKHMHEILFLVSNNPSGSMSFLAERLSCRLAKTKDRIVALRTLLLIHRLLRGGNRGFEQQLQSAHLSGHLKITGINWRRMRRRRNISDPLFCFLHNYAAYLEERMEWAINQAGKLEPAAVASQGVGGLALAGFNFCGILPKCQVLLDKVLAFGILLLPPCSDDHHHMIQLAQAAMSNTLKESFQVYTAFCEGVAALVNVFFDLTGPSRSLACNILKRASLQTQQLSDFYDNCKKVQMGNKINLDYPLVQVIAMDHITALEQLSLDSCGIVLTRDIGKSVPSILNFKIPKSTHHEMQVITIKGRESTDTTKDIEPKSANRLSSTLFSCTLETKISKVWVVFDDDDVNPDHEVSSVSADRVFSSGGTDIAPRAAKIA